MMKVICQIPRKMRNMSKKWAHQIDSLVVAAGHILQQSADQ